ncbi:hypothetical protein SAMN06297387_112173 [Streptomyces zhaozhouensis]|uniref:Small secreted domain n=1 Tax=Streptomyces zhaozhouensis TaxID=1300267 RepID=A0A286DYV0_9ACTN|nr:hypothetical protein [Streptomyces zhaozhouensis]SOD63813.1 hypothetical protein SAMN06297387_112173 [Streptomyces zhaozhouensis]
MKVTRFATRAAMTAVGAVAALTLLGAGTASADSRTGSDTDHHPGETIELPEGTPSVPGHPIEELPPGETIELPEGTPSVPGHPIEELPALPTVPVEDLPPGSFVPAPAEPGVPAEADAE